MQHTPSSMQFLVHTAASPWIHYQPGTCSVGRNGHEDSVYQTRYGWTWPFKQSGYGFNGQINLGPGWSPNYLFLMRRGDFSRQQWERSWGRTHGTLGRSMVEWISAAGNRTPAVLHWGAQPIKSTAQSQQFSHITPLVEFIGNVRATRKAGQPNNWPKFRFETDAYKAKIRDAGYFGLVFWDRETKPLNNCI